MLQRAPVLRRIMAAWVYDYVLCLWLASIALFVLRWLTGQTANQQIHLQVLTLLIFVFRDSLTGKGSSIGKLLTGIKLTDIETGKAPDVRQNTLRNMVLLGPFFAYNFILTLSDMACFAQILSAHTVEVIKIILVGVTSVLVVVEYFLMFGKNGLRLADRLGRTRVILAEPASATGIATETK